MLDIFDRIERDSGVLSDSISIRASAIICIRNLRASLALI